MVPAPHVQSAADIMLFICRKTGRSYTDDKGLHLCLWAQEAGMCPIVDISGSQNHAEIRRNKHIVATYLDCGCFSSDHRTAHTDLSGFQDNFSLRG